MALSRIRNLTTKGQEAFEEAYSKKNERARRAWYDVERCIEIINDSSDVQELREKSETLKKCIRTYDIVHQEVIDFCNRTNTVQSIDLADKEQEQKQRRADNLQNIIKSVNDKLAYHNHETKSVVSSSSRRSRSSSVQSSASLVIAKTRAKVEAAKVRLEFAEVEAELKKKQAILEQNRLFEIARTKKEEADLAIELDLLSSKKETAAVEAEINALELSERGSSISDFDEELAKRGSFDKEKRTREYVNSVESVISAGNNAPGKQSVTNVPTVLNPTIKEFVPRSISRPVEPQQQLQKSTDPNSTVIADLSRFLLKKDLLLSRLTSFTDRPEHYRIWKSSFQLIMKELEASAQEEIDLLQKWSGPECQKHIINIKSANVHCAELSVKKIWDRLDERFGSAEMLEASLKTRVSNFPKLTPKDSKKLYEFSDLVAEIESVKADPEMTVMFAHYDSSAGVNPLVNKLPQYLQHKWTSCASKYMKENYVTFPPLEVFSTFLREESKISNNPCFVYDTSLPKSDKHQTRSAERNIAVKKTDTKDSSSSQLTQSDTGTGGQKCPLHQTNHSLNKCRTFKTKPLQERFKFLREQRICFKCCESTSHIKKDCTKSVKCFDCQSDSHPTALHVNVNNGHISGRNQQPQTAQGGEWSNDVKTACTQICGSRFPGKSCAKLVLGSIHQESKPDESIPLYVTIDDQSNKSIASSRLFDMLGIEGDEIDYVLTSCSGKTKTSGRRTDGLVLESNDRSTRIELPMITECSYIPDNRDEIPTPEVARWYPHLQDIAGQIPQLNEGAQIMLLLGRDVTRAHYVMDQRIGPGNTPYAQKLPLGWTIIGESCLGKMHSPDQFNINKTSILENGRPTLFEPCTNTLNLQDSAHKEVKSREHELFGQDVFQRTKNDEMPGLSIDDRTFLKIMEKDFLKDKEGNWTCPLPFREDKASLKNNFSEVLKRAKSLDRSLSKDPQKKANFLDFMQKLLENGHAEIAPPLAKDEECWYLPIFGVYHPKKREQVRVVFDSAAKYHGVALNDVLLSGPDLTNSLLGVLLRFRRETVAVIADIQQMFYCFKVNKEHRNYLRFLWHANNDFDEPLVEYRMCVHVFGNTASPAVATYGLRKAVSFNSVNSKVTEFVNKDFYVDDGLVSCATTEEAIDLIRQTQTALKSEGNLRLHKIASNKEEVMLAFPPEDLAKDIKDLDLGSETLPTQRSLGIAWDLASDSFLFRISMGPQPYTRRGLLSTVNSIFDPLGFLAPVVIEGKLLLRKLVHGTVVDWDAPLPEEFRSHWDQWRKSLECLDSLRIPRVYLPSSFEETSQKSIHIFADASESAIAAVGYVRDNLAENQCLGFVLGKAKVAPTSGHTIPRLELCAAVLAIEVAESISRHLNLPVQDFRFYSDSRVVLGYICNQSRRFYTYVSNRVQRIRSVSKPSQWYYVPTNKNPADQGTRSISASEMNESLWLTGPSFLLKEVIPSMETFHMQEPDEDKEVRPEVVTLKTSVENKCASLLGSHRFARFSSWKRLVEAISYLRYVASCSKKDSPLPHKTVESFDMAAKQIIKEVQKEVYSEEFQLMKSCQSVPKTSPIAVLSPFVDHDGLIRVGGRLKHARVNSEEKNPVLVPGDHHIAALLVRYYHERSEHQGRHITAGAIRSAGLWITKSKRLISSYINKCVKCQKLRGRPGSQRMADLPEDRLEPGPPFTSVGVDCFGPWTVVTRRTRGGQANSKRWAALFTCLTTRAVHIEVLEEMSSSSFINALKRFIAIRGPVKIIRSDQGTNFIGTVSELGIEAHTLQEKKVHDFLYNNHCTWIFNPPHASHMGGIWERMIGVTRRILDSLLMDVSGSGLTHEVLVTFLAEASAIVNSRPLVPVSTDPEDPFPLSPSLILTQKSGPCLPSKDFSTKDMYKSQWKRVQLLADTFWTKWKSQYLHTLQGRRKWRKDQRNFMIGDVVLLSDKQTTRMDWPMGIVSKTFKSEDDLVRTIEVRVIQDGDRATTFIRPVTEVVLLLSEESDF